MADADLLEKVWLFHRLGRESLEKLAAFAFRKTYKSGDVIVEEGQTGNGLFVIDEGKVEVIRRLGSQRPERLAVLGAGDVFGEMALIDELPRSASVRAVDDTTCVGIDRFLFISQLYKDPELAITMLQVLARRLRDTSAGAER
jgi:CRP/FNR family cyclic AMP-dependent transcriptional regulator